MREAIPNKTHIQGADHPREGASKNDQADAVGLGDLCVAVGNTVDALAYYRQALSAVPPAAVNERLSIILKLSACLRRQGNADEALALVDGVLGAFEGRSRRDLMAEKANLLCILGRYGEAGTVCERILTDEPCQDLEKDASVYLVLGHVLLRLCRWKHAIVCFEQAATFSRMCRDDAALSSALNNLGIVYKNLCRFEDSARYLRKSADLARRMRDDASLCVRLLNLAITELKTGKIDRADRSISECLHIAEMLGIQRTRYLGMVCKARIEKARGNLDGGLSVLNQVISEGACLDERRVWYVANETLGEILTDKGDLQKARSVLEACLAEIPCESKDLVAEIRSRLAEVYLATGKRDAAREHAEEGLRMAEECGDAYEAARCLRQLARASAEPGRARRAIAKAERAFAAMGARFERALTLQARAHLDGVSIEQAVKDLREAADLFRSCGTSVQAAKALCDRAVLLEAEARYDLALSCLEEAEACAGDEPYGKEPVCRARARLDRSLSKALPSIPRSTVASAAAAFSHLASSVGASAMVLARVGADSTAEVVEAIGLDRDAASRLAGAVAAKRVSPFVSTDTADLVPTSACFSSMRLVIAIGLGSEGRRGVAVFCWRKDRRHGPSSAPDVSFLVRAYYEISEVIPVFEETLESSAPSRVPVCVGGMLTADPALKRVLLSLPRVAASSSNVLITGETGTGKELVAKAIHVLSPRSSRPFVVQNCAALPEPLLESELFGHRAGAFTDARSEKTGLLEAASGGTFFLDEVGDITPAIQAKMLRAIESREIRRLGDTATRAIDVRFLSATNKNLDVEVESGRFRRDLYYRLNVVALKLPPLRDRRDDIGLLASVFLRRLAFSMGRPVKSITSEALRALTSYGWPGNVRQLENEMERAVAISRVGDALDVDALSPAITGGERGGAELTLRDEVREVERARIVAALEKSKWNKTHAAKLLGDMSRPALIAKMKRLGIPLRART